MANSDEFHIDNRLMDRCFISSNPSNKFLLINIPKNASCTMRTSLNTLEYTPYNEILNTDDYVKVCVLRNPIYRVISIYLEVKKLRRDGPHYITRNMKWFKMGNNPIESFNMFLDAITDNFYDEHSFPQLKLLTDKGLSTEDMDEVFIFEDLRSEFAEFVEKYGQNFRLGYINEGDNRIKKILTEYVENNSEVRDKIIELYKEDYEIWEKYKDMKFVDRSRSHSMTEKGLHSILWPDKSNA